MARFVALSLLAAGCATLAFVGPLPTHSAAESTALRAKRSHHEVGGPQAMEELEQTSPMRIGSALLAVLAAVALTVLPVEEAKAARSGGRIGGSASSARRAPPRAPPRAPAAASSSNTTVINRTTVVAPPPVMAAPSIGFGMAPVVVAPPPTVGDVIVGSVVGGAINNAMYGNRGPSTADRMLENQQRQDERQLDNQQREIEQLKAELNSLKTQK